jgi:hypothetical protein
MAYIGRQPLGGEVILLDSIESQFNGVLTTFNLSRTISGTSSSFYPVNSEQLLVSLGGVIQKPDTSGTTGFKISFNQIIFAVAPVTGTSCFIISYGNLLDIGSPANNTVSTDKLVDGSVTPIKLSTGGPWWLSNGNVGIGTTNPQYKLDVNGNIYFKSTASGYVTGNDGSQIALTGNLLMVSSNAGATDSGIHLRGGIGGAVDWAIYNSGTTSNLVVRNDNAVNVLEITGTGNVGIGTTNPEARLHARGPDLGITAGDFATAARFTTGTSNRSNVDIVSLRHTNGDTWTTTETRIQYNVDSSTIKRSWISFYNRNTNTLDNVIRFGEQIDSEWMRIQDGNVGIGTANPSSQLHITGQFQSTQSNAAANGAGQIYLNGATGNRIDFNTNGVAAPSFTTRSAGTKIVLYPNVSATFTDAALGVESGTLWYSIEQASDNRQHRWYGGTTQLADLKGTGELVLGGVTTLTGTSSQKLQVTGGAYISGNVGIGTTNPQYKLDVYGGSIVARNLGGTTSIQVGVGQNSNQFAYVDLVGDTTYNDYGFRIIRNNTGENANSNLIHRGTGTFGLYATEAAPIGFYTTNTERVRILANGKVGIGTTNPNTNATLDVQGTIYVTGSYETANCLYGQGGGSITGGAAGTINTLPAGAFRSVEYTIQATVGTNYHITKILAIHNGTNVNITEYGTMFTNTSVATYSIDISGGNIVLTATPASASQTTFKMSIIAIKV